MKFHLVQFNINKSLFPFTAPQLRSYRNYLQELNDLAETSPGFIWQLNEGQGNCMIGDRVFGDPLTMVNMSVWEDLEAFMNYSFSGSNLKLAQEQKKWFRRLNRPSEVLWWCKSGRIPSAGEGKEKLMLLERQGPCEQAFTLDRPFYLDHLGQNHGFYG